MNGIESSLNQFAVLHGRRRMAAGAASAGREPCAEVDRAQWPRLAELIGFCIFRATDAQRGQRGDAVHVFADEIERERLRAPRDPRRASRADARHHTRTYLKIVASEDGLRAAGAQEPEFTGSK